MSSWDNSSDAELIRPARAKTSAFNNKKIQFVPALVSAAGLSPFSNRKGDTRSRQASQNNGHGQPMHLLAAAIPWAACKLDAQQVLCYCHSYVWAH